MLEDRIERFLRDLLQPAFALFLCGVGGWGVGVGSFRVESDPDLGHFIMAMSIICIVFATCLFFNYFDWLVRDL